MGQTPLLRHWRGLQGQLRRWAWPGATGLLSLVAAGLAWLIWLPGLAQQQQVLLAATELAQPHAKAAAARPAATRPAPSRQRFRDGLPPATSRHARLSALLVTARRHGLPPTNVELRLSDDTALEVARYTVTTPLSGSYTALRAFIEDALAHDPGLSLDRLRLTRSAVTDAAVTAELEWSLYMRTEESLVAAAAAPAGKAGHP
jgi:hypothetical protein